MKNEKFMKQLLKDPVLYPADELLQQVMGELFKIFSELRELLTVSHFTFNYEWNYYKDGKAWLCKVVNKRKTILWLSVWDSSFKAGFYFTEKHRTGINELSIDEEIKKDFNQSKPIGRLLPLAITVTNRDQIIDILKITDYKYTNMN
jgi:hypothetical protein